MQVQTFRRFRGNPFASTMCTGNLCSGTEALLARCIFENDAGCGRKAGYYYRIILSFTFGVIIGMCMLTAMGEMALLFVPIGLIFVLPFIINRQQWENLRKVYRKH